MLDKQNIHIAEKINHVFHKSKSNNNKNLLFSMTAEKTKNIRHEKLTGPILMPLVKASSAQMCS
jgi:hypothetical protein